MKCILTIFTFLTLCLGIKDEIIFVAPVIRHGARYLLFEEYANITDWQGNPGELTNVGKHQLYLLGRQLSYKYMTENTVLSPRFLSKQIEVFSAGLSRVEESTLSLLYGLYGPGLGASLSASQIEAAVPPIAVQDLDKIRAPLRDAALPNYQRPIPIRTGSLSNDFFFNAPKYCNTFKEEERRLQRKFKKINKENKEFYKNLTETFGFSDWDTDKCYFLYDNVASVKGNGKKLKMTIDPVLYKQLEQISLMNNLHVFLGSNLKAKLTAHMILSRIKTYFEDAVRNSKAGMSKDEILRMGIFTASDLHINAIHRIFGWDKLLQVPVPFASCLVFELHRLEDKFQNVVYTVKASFNEDLVPRDLKSLSAYSKFDKFLKANTFADDKDFMDHCYVNEGETFDQSTYLALSIVLFLTFLTLWGSNWVYLVFKQREMNQEKDRLPM